MKIVFRCDPALQAHLPPPLPARAALPDWLRAMPNGAFSPTHGQEVRTVKQCPPFVDAMAYGFIMPLPCDVMVQDGALSWNWDVPKPSIYAHPRSPISFHVPEQAAGAPLFHPDRVLVKFNSFWTVQLEPGWSLFATHPVNRDDLPFRLVTGLVGSAPLSALGQQFTAVWTDPAVSGVLPRGTPVAQCFAVPRAAPELVVEPLSPEQAAQYAATAEALLSARRSAAGSSHSIPHRAVVTA